MRLIVAEKGQHGRGVFGETPPVQIVRPTFLRTRHHSATCALVDVEAATGARCPIDTNTDRHRLIQVLLRGAASACIYGSTHTATTNDLSIPIAIRQGRLRPDRHHQMR